MQIDFLVYCERLHIGLWAEPVNLLSNIGFLVAGAWVLVRCRRRGLKGNHWEVWLLGLLMVAIGIGSALWHSFHADWAEALDKLPLLLFIHLFLYSFLHRQFGLTPLFAVTVTVLFFAASKTFAGVVDPRLLNGSIFYAPALVAFAALTVLSLLMKLPSGRAAALALIVFIASLSFRTVDAGICTMLPTGTHFLWHLLNALVLAMLVGILMNPTNRRPAAGVQRAQA